MSTNLAYAPARPIRTDAPQPHIAPVARPVRRAKPRVTYVLVIVAALFAIYLGQLALSIALSQGAYQISSLQDQQKELLRTQEALTERLDLLKSPQNLANNAIGLGMTPAESRYALRLSDGSVSTAAGTNATAACGECNLVANSLLTGVPLVKAPPPATGGVATPATNTETPAAGELPSPVTH